MNKLLILSATAGAGHVRAADALVTTARTLHLPLTIEHRDILDFTYPIFKKVYSQVNNTIAGHAPELWGYLYKRAERKGLPKPKHPLLKVFDQFNFKKYLRFIHDFHPDAVLCTHFLPYLAITDELKKPSWRIPFYSIPTDYDVHSLWINPSVKHYFVATDEAAWTVRSYGVGEKNITITGIPVHPEFTSITSKLKARKSLGLEAKRLTIMILSGGYGIGVIDKLVPSILEFLSLFERMKFSVVVVCGRNQKLFDTLSLLTPPPNVAFQCYGFVTFIDKLMDASDVLVTKSGGLTVSEALAKHLPMIIFDPVPGQEGRNADYINEHGAAMRTSGFANLNFKLKRLIEEPERLVAMKKYALAIAKPNAAEEILKYF
ncbi:MAG: hypothetical protein EPO24_11775 [Bacteroidetes bacterium]|nr:MAG: hypothetical protein EPO24_11775 [Bacteroidota bacterium]